MNSDPSAIGIPVRRHRLRLHCLVAMIMLALGLVVPGCNRTNETSRENRRLVDAVLTAVTMRNSEELSKDKKLLAARQAAGQLLTKTHATILRIIEKAEAKDWETAERELYEFRKRVPFPA